MPFAYRKYLKKISKTNIEIPFWSVIRNDNGIIKLDNYEHWTTALENEGFSLEFTKTKQIKALVTENQRFQLETAL